MPRPKQLNSEARRADRVEFLVTGCFPPQSPPATGYGERCSMPPLWGKGQNPSDQPIQNILYAYKAAPSGVNFADIKLLSVSQLEFNVPFQTSFSEISVGVWAYKTPRSKILWGPDLWTPRDRHLRLTRHVLTPAQCPSMEKILWAVGTHEKVYFSWFIFVLCQPVAVRNISTEHHIEPNDTANSHNQRCAFT